LRVLVISANTEQISAPVLPLGAALVAAAARRAGHEVGLLNLMDDQDTRSRLESEIAQLDPEVIGVSVRNIDDQSMRDTRFLLPAAKKVLDLCRELSPAPRVLGGAGYSIYPQAALNFLEADMGVQGDGETAFVALLRGIASGSDLTEVPGLYLPGRGLCGRSDNSGDLNHDPLPLPEDLPWIPAEAKDLRLWIPVQTRRGCPMGCSYCSTSTIEGRLLRKHAPERVVESLARFVERGFRHFQFVDNTFNLPPSYVEGICDRIVAAGLKIQWLAIIYPSRMNEKLIAKMARAGCRGVSLGSESGSDSMLKNLGKRFSAADVRRVSEAFGEQGVTRMGFLMLGGPGETRETVRESLVFSDSLKLDSLKCTLGIRIYPYTRLARTAVEQGVIAADDDLLYPKFYMVPGLEGWLRETLSDWVKDRPGWVL